MRRGGAPQQIDLATAKKMIAGAEASATARNEHVAITVMDARGDIVAFERMDTLNSVPVSTPQGQGACSADVWSAHGSDRG